MKWFCSICCMAVLLAGGINSAEAVPNERIN
ncbi:polysaccharide deacetylase, partial [Bacillus velezensis]